MKKDLPSQPAASSAGIEFHKVNAAGWDWRDTYHWMLTLTWPRFAVFLLGVYLVINAVFAGLFCVERGCVDGMTP